MNSAHNFGEGEAKIGGNSVKLIQKYSFCFYFLNFVANFWDKIGNLVIRKVQGGVLMLQGQIGEFFKPREIGSFSHF